MVHLDIVSLAKLPFLLHDVVATLAGLTFVVRPSAQLAPLTPSASLILQCYGGLILFTTLISLIFLRRPFDETTRIVALAFAFWHCWPSYRAYVRILHGIDTKGKLATTLGGPWVHLGVHLALFVLFIYSGFLA